MRRDLARRLDDLEARAKAGTPSNGPYAHLSDEEMLDLVFGILRAEGIPEPGWDDVLAFMERNGAPLNPSPMTSGAPWSNGNARQTAAGFAGTLRT